MLYRKSIKPWLGLGIWIVTQPCDLHQLCYFYMEQNFMIRSGSRVRQGDRKIIARNCNVQRYEERTIFRFIIAHLQRIPFYKSSYQIVSKIERLSTTAFLHLFVTKKNLSEFVTDINRFSNLLSRLKPWSATMTCCHMEQVTISIAKRIFFYENVNY